MSDTAKTILIIAAIVLVLLAILGLVLRSMRSKSNDANRSQAAELRKDADVQAAGLPDARARAEQAEQDAERARQEAARAEERSATAGADVAQQEAVHEDRLRAADRLDPDVDHKAKDYSPEVGTPVVPANVPSEQPYADRDTGNSVSDRPSTSAGATGAAAGTAAAGTAAGSADRGEGQAVDSSTESTSTRENPVTILDADDAAPSGDQEHRSTSESSDQPADQSSDQSADQAGTEERIDTAPRDESQSASFLDERLTSRGESLPGLPQRVRGASDMPGGQDAKSDWSDNWFKRQDDPPKQ